jgi:hypothetical protein
MRWIARIFVFTAALMLGACAVSLFGAMAGSGLSDSAIPVASSRPPKGVHIMYAGWWPESDERLATMRFIVHNGNDVPVTYRATTPADALPQVRIDGKKYETWGCGFGIKDFQIAPGASAEILATRWDFPRDIAANAQATVGLYLRLNPSPRQPHDQTPDILAITEPFTIPEPFRTIRRP